MEGIELGGLAQEKQIESLNKQVKLACCCAGFGVFLGWISFAIAVATPAGLIVGWAPFVHPTGVVLSTKAAQSLSHRDSSYVLGDSVFKGQGEWASIPPMPRRLSDLSAVVVKQNNEDMVLILGGMDENDRCNASATLFDPLLKTYTDLAPMPSPRVRFGAAVSNGRVYVAGGFLCSGANSAVDAVATDVVHVFDLAARTWSNGPSTSVKRGDPCAAAVGDTVYLVGGYDTENNYAQLGSVETLDASANPAVAGWKAGPSMPTPRGDTSCVNIDGHLGVLGGWNAEWTEPLGTFETLHGGAWTRRPSMRRPRGDFGAAVLPGGRLVVLGGERSARARTQISIHEADMFDFGAGVWVEVAPLVSPRFCFAAVAVDTGGEGRGEVYAFGGHSVCTTVTDPSTYAIVSNNCPATAKSSVEAFLSVTHTPLFYYVDKSS